MDYHRLFTCFHYIHIEKTAPHPGGHKTHVLTKSFNEDWTKNVTCRVENCPALWRFHDDWAKIVTSRVFTRTTAPPPGGHLHEDWASNVTSTVFTSFDLSRGINGTNVLTKFHEDRTISFWTDRRTQTDGRRQTDAQTDGQMDRRRRRYYYIPSKFFFLRG
ncbi:hypothetical protein DPMN_162147 [Dreissena polymorpha]|uniref:Uncharacterized protein n=1 Tax=Dreissena polymorpha TaxID=45954 RepID=A0A9D4EQ23_DREPO|nr:hypothetical protein DPMN_162147 [Dreissena polymorpha]